MSGKKKLCFHKDSTQKNGHAAIKHWTWKVDAYDEH